jgi:hypothetical protein
MDPRCRPAGMTKNKEPWEMTMGMRLARPQAQGYLNLSVNNLSS